MVSHPNMCHPLVTIQKSADGLYNICSILPEIENGWIGRSLTSAFVTVGEFRPDGIRGMVKM
jgi:hypothetical protein